LQDIKDLYILGEPIETKIGNLHFLKVCEYTSILGFMAYLQLEKWEVVNLYKDDKEFYDLICELSFFDIIKLFKSIEEIKNKTIKEHNANCIKEDDMLTDYVSLYTKYKELFVLCFKEDVIDRIDSDKLFEEYRNKIMKMNGIPKEEKNPNPEIQRFINMKKMLNRNKSNGITFESIYTSVWAFCGYKPSDMTLYELYALFNRIGQFKNYDTTVLYSTVTSDVKIESWAKHAEINEEEKKSTLSEFSKSANSIMN
jgi:hypothetical protein